MITDDDYRLFMLSTWKHPHFADLSQNRLNGQHGLVM